MSFNCGGISETCEVTDWTFNYEYDGVEYVKSWELVEEIIYIGTFFITQALIRMSAQLTENMIKGMNALQCAFKSGFINMALLVESAYYALRQFGMEDLLIDNVNEYYPYICTCKEDVDNLGKWLGSDEELIASFSSCSETDYDQCWFPTAADDGTATACGNCEYYYYDADVTECVECEVAEYDGSTYSCNTDCTNYVLNVDVCEYDCTAQETDADGNVVCVCDGYADDSSGGCAAV